MERDALSCLSWQCLHDYEAAGLSYVRPQNQVALWRDDVLRLPASILRLMRPFTAVFEKFSYAVEQP